MPESELANEGRRFGRYRVVGELGSGAPFVVYRGEHVTTGRVVAIKTLRPSVASTSPLATRLEHEARVLAQLAHPNVVMSIDWIAEEGSPHHVLEYIDGVNLKELTESTQRRFPVDFVLGIGAEVAWGLAHVHARGVVHRDLTPSNVLVSRHGDVKIVDFDIAQSEASSPDPEAFGTAAYVAPEQLLDDRVDGRADLFALGALLYELVSGQRPFPPPARGAPLRRAESPRPIEEKRSELPRELSRLVTQLMAQNPVDRPEGAAVVARTLEGILTSRGAATSKDAVLLGLVELGVISTSPSGDAGRAPARGRPAAWLESVRGGKAIALSLAVGLGFVSGVAAGARWLGHRERTDASPAASPRGAVRVVARPWAEVWVDGHEVDVTPLGQPIRLTAGEHVLRFVHPAAPPEERRVTLMADREETVEVDMRLPKADASPDGNP